MSLISVSFIKILVFYGWIYRRWNSKFNFTLYNSFIFYCIGIYALFGVETENDDDDSDSGSGGLMQPIWHYL